MQDEGSMLVAHALKPKAGTQVIDACGGPGTKTTHLAQLMGDTGHILAMDIHEHRLNLIRQGCERLGVKSVETLQGDARELNRYVQKADFILLDAPCSGLGVLGRKADARWRKTPEQIKELSVLQLEMLTQAARVLAPEGVMVYSTCSITREENQEVVNSFLKQNPDFQLEDLTAFLPFIPEREEDRKGIQSGMLQLLPHVHGVDGFFMARLRKNGEPRPVAGVQAP